MVAEVGVTSSDSIVDVVSLEVGAVVVVVAVDVVDAVVVGATVDCSSVVATAVVVVIELSEVAVSASSVVLSTKNQKIAPAKSNRANALPTIGTSRLFSSSSMGRGRALGLGGAGTNGSPFALVEFSSEAGWGTGVLGGGCFGDGCEEAFEAESAFMLFGRIVVWLFI